MTTEELVKSFESKVEALKAGQVSKEDIEALKTGFETQLKEVKDGALTAEAVKTIFESEAEKLISDLSNKDSKSENALAKEILENKEALKAIAARQVGEVELKALTNRAAITNNGNAYDLPDIGQLGVKERALYNVLPKIQMPNPGNDKGIIRYRDWDEATTVRAAATVAEGAAFPESTAKWQDYTLSIQKIGDTLPVTEEFLEDEAMTAAELEMFIDVNVQTKIDDQIINGDGIGTNLKGILTSVPTYTPVASNIPAANIKDLVRKMRTSIVKNRGSKYSPDIVIMNSDTFDRYYLAKDGENNYLFNTELGTIAGLFVVEDNNMPDNQLIVGDRRFAKIYEKGGVVLSEGEINAQFTSDMKTIKARKRMAMLIRNVDSTGFLKCTNITTALTTLATAP